ncbi:integrase core domain protein [Mycobacterium xenopi 4042]|uniref:Integrase core domain protein n=1 Tax=Mycobacterium xenopi 4042 TaxID=1299334 RepID=X7ZDC9_MYCXE|nr:integrase core domain protein [Mycobacterium xenopi 4042]
MARLMRPPASRESGAANGSAPPNPTRPRPASGFGEAQLHRDRPEPALGDRPDVRADLGRVAYVCFIIDAYSRMIVGWRVASHMRTSMVLDALEMARWSRGNMLPGLRCHSDAGSQFTSIRYGERLAEIGAVPSIGTVGTVSITLSRRRSTATTRPN